MRTYRCVCGNRLHFGNTRCLSCQRSLGFVPEWRLLTPLEADAAAGRLRALALPDQPQVRRCANHESARCDWLVAGESSDRLCLACRLTQTIPDLSVGDNRLYWRRLESAKRYLICDLVRLGLPVPDRHRDPERGLTFDFLADQETPEGLRRITTGHDRGRITINIAEADDVHRERVRVTLGEAYRTLLGHMRHESGHYYWIRLVDGGPWLDAFRAGFGDERRRYADAMRAYYDQGPPPDWRERHISAYASAHPWEDWAESWAHYLHITDAMETARDFGLVAAAGAGEAFAAELERWGELSQALNALSRSVGVGDPYPFVVTATVADKLHLIHQIVEDAASGSLGRPANSRFKPSLQASRSATK